MLADALPDPASASSVGWLMLCAAAAIASINQVDSFVKRRTGKENQREIGPQPFVVKPEAEYVSRRDFELHVAEINREREHFRTELANIARGIREELRQELGALYEKLNALAVGMARVETEQRGTAMAVSQMGELLNAELLRRNGKT